MKSLPADERILSIDIGGSHIKATVLDPDGNQMMDYEKVETPTPSDPEHVLAAILELTNGLGQYTLASVGFPGYVTKGIVRTAPNLGTDQWKGVDVTKRLSSLLNRPVRTVNDADLQGLGIARGEGLEMVVTLGTGFGTALLYEGGLLPHLEIAHHPFADGKTYDDYIGEKALEKVGEEKWNLRLKEIIDILKIVFNYDHLYLGGGNAKKINFKTDSSITRVTNMEGIKGGAKLWQKENHHSV
jgi:polyphosphate glucokinase